MPAGKNDIKDLRYLLKGLTAKELNKIEPNIQCLSILFSCSERQIGNYRANGMPDGLVDCISWRLKYETSKPNSTSQVTNSLKDKKESLIIEKLEEQLKEIRKESIDISKHNEILNSRASQLKTFLLESLDRNAFHFANQDVDNVREELRTFAEKFIEQYIASAESDDD